NALQNYSHTKKLLSQRWYWQQVVKAYQPLMLASQEPVKVKDLASHRLRFSPEETQNLIQVVPKVYHTEVNDLLIAALAKTLCEWAETNTITIGLEGHGREDILGRIDISHTVGWFTNLYPLLLSIDTRKGEDDLIKSVKEQLRQVPERGMGFGVLKYINKDQDLRGKEPWDVLFNYLGQLDNVVNKSKWFSAAAESVGPGRSEEHEVNEKLLVNCSIQAGQLTVNWSYSNKHFSEPTILTFAENYRLNVQKLIGWCIKKQDTTIATPSDYGLATNITYHQLDNFLNERYREKSRKDYLEDIYKLSGLQQGMLFHSLYDSQVKAYTDQFKCNLLKVDVEALEKSWQSILKNHTILRTGFYSDAFSIPVQCVYSDVRLPLEVIDFTQLDKQQQDCAINEYAEKVRVKGFDFKKPPLMQVALFRLAHDKYTMLWTYHHIIFDGWSMPVLIEEFLTTYESIISGGRIAEKLQDRYGDYIRYIEGVDKDKEEAYWRNYMDGLQQGTLLPFIETTAERTKGVGEYKQSVLPINTGTTNKIQQYAQKHHITVNTLMQGIWSLLLHKYTGNSNIVYGGIVSGRPDELPGIEHRVGLYINTLPMHSYFQEEQRIVDWLQNLQNQQVSTRQYQHTPLQVVQGWLGIQGELFDSILAFENYPVSKVVNSKTWAVEVDNLDIHYQTNYPLTILIGGTDEIEVVFSYNSKLLQDTYVEKIRGHFENVLLQIIRNGRGKLSDIRILSQNEEHQLLVEFNNTNATYAKDKTIVGLFQEQVNKNPNRVALLYKEERLTYNQLNEKSNRLAHLLKGKGVTKHTLVPICIDRSFEMVIGLIGILKAGGTYVPIDAAYPLDRIQYILSDTAAKLVVSSTLVDYSLKLSERSEVILVDSIIQDNNLPSNEATLDYEPEDTVCIIYTSGSTGQPKGAKLSNAGIVNRMYWMFNTYPFSENEVGALKTSVGFADHIWEIFGPLAKGIPSVIFKKEELLDLDILLENVAKHKITRWVLVPSLLRAILDKLVTAGDLKLPDLKYWTSSGEALTSDLTYDFYKIFPAATHKLLNIYGSSEVTADVTYYDTSISYSEAFKDGESRNVPIGKPLSNCKIYIVDKGLNLVPGGCIGEIYVGGIQVSKGYLNKPTLTAEKFIKDVFDKEGEALLYKTGDLGRWLTDGNIEYLGRIDDQVKIRGYRIELGEIESVLLQSGLVDQVVVLAEEDAAGHKRLVGYVVAEGKFDRDAITSYLQGKVPEYMVPAFWVALETIPLTPNGKIDKKALPTPNINELMLHQYEAPRNEVEKALVKIWEDLLGLQRVGIYDNFFEIGGDSILTIQVVTRINRMGYTLQPKDIFAHQTIAGLSSAISNQVNTSLAPEQGELTGIYRLLPTQESLLEMIGSEISAINQAVILSLNKSINDQLLSAAFAHLVGHHDVLKSKFYQKDGRWQQEYANIKIDLVTEELQPDNEGVDIMGEELYRKHVQHLDVERGKLIRPVLIKTGATEEHNRLLIIIHQLLIDETSWRILIQDLERVLTQLSSDNEGNLGDKTNSYRQWFNVIKEYSESSSLFAQNGYWQKVIRESYAFRTDKVYTGEINLRDVKDIEILVDEENTRLLLEEIKGTNLEARDLILASVGQTLCEWAETDTVTINVDGDAREKVLEGIDVSRTIGLFKTRYPVILNAGTEHDSQALIKAVKEQLRKVPDNGLGFSVLKYVNEDK
ncbi:MAG: Nonribosomal peptide synthetase, partial [Segetibacter sp.]|nr:Nonribosomal peptide synthetase [Segetibacter sp.]